MVSVPAQRLQALELRGFRNLKPTSFRPGPRFNVVHGDNGQGKSNLLEAIDYLRRLKSFRGASTDELIAHGQPAADLRARLDLPPAPRTYQVRLQRGAARKIAVDGKRPRSHAAHAAACQIVLFHAGDLQLTSGGPDQRRGFLDRMLEAFDTSYASTLASYDRALRSRNRLLKADRPDRNAIRAFDALLADAGAVIGQSRTQLVTEMAASVAEMFETISQQALGLRLAYEPRVEPTVAELSRALTDNLPKDLARGFTTAGPHSDDLGFHFRQARAKRFASQGQHRAIVLALKVVELQELARRVGSLPILLLDDVSSELDRTRNRLFFQALSALGGQVFLTTTHPEFILLGDAERQDHAISDGQIIE